jgi:hypothetical protein
VGRSGRLSALIDGLLLPHRFELGSARRPVWSRTDSNKSDSDELSSRPFIHLLDSAVSLLHQPDRSVGKGYTALDYSLALLDLASHLSNTRVNPLIDSLVHQIRPRAIRVCLLPRLPDSLCHHRLFLLFLDTLYCLERYFTFLRRTQTPSTILGARHYRRWRLSYTVQYCKPAN